MKRIILKAGEEVRIKRGHPWVYDNEVASVLGPRGPASLEPGETADVESSRKEYLGRAFVNPNSKIIARIYSPSKEGADTGFFKRRIRQALERRLPFCDLNRESARIVFGEADMLPGLIVDRFVGWPLEKIESDIPGRPFSYADAESRLGPPLSWLSVQFLSYGMDLRRDDVLRALHEVLESYDPAGPAPADPSGPAAVLGIPSGIMERSDAKVRELEGLGLRSQLSEGEFPGSGIVIFENGYPFIADLRDGQKTGHYLDQKENRLRAAHFARGRRVLDACSNTGGFSIHLGRAGASEVTALDSSAHALEILEKNAALNGISDRINTVCGDLFDTLHSWERRKEKFDLIVLDPPAFAKSRSALEGAVRGYKEINLRALRLLSPGGVLVTCSCSHAMGEGRFKAMVADAACDADRRIVQMDFRCQSPDHPVLVGYDESLYLKCGYYRILL
ncbi:class I SAM-dependent rRNA methyltransferase [Breznakiella homolactica]|uniref:Class I SAM-dependent rRNA methyltransferase n=1 Tax=Breznakiella homolactica TaxID=2798577 RepID=A0A7T8BAC0_9SPIR|nr:class I SAM-dependent rRNA methyltransferase [Breznakiella homolactica]QQO10504.1 class I SAM-dependent rRNA methyltransferase [Breznakiella homolactica]